MKAAFKPGHMYRAPYPFPSSTGEKHPQAKLTDAQVREIRRRFAAGEDVDVLAREFGINRNYVRVLSRKERRATA